MCKHSWGSRNKLPPAPFKRNPSFLPGLCTRWSPLCCKTNVFLVQCSRSGFKISLGLRRRVTTQRVLKTTWNQSALSSLGMLAEDGEKQKERFATSQQDTGGRFFPEHVRRDRVEMVLAPGCVGQRLHKTSDRNFKCFTAFFLCGLSRRFTQITTVSKREAERFIADYCKLIHNAFFLPSFKHQAG